MPVYEYVCENCNNIKSIMHSSIPKTVEEQMVEFCSACTTINTFKKIISKSSFHLSRGGVGWAKDGYDRSSQDGSKVVSLDEPK